MYSSITHEKRIQNTDTCHKKMLIHFAKRLTDVSTEKK